MQLFVHNEKMRLALFLLAVCLVLMMLPLTGLIMFSTPDDNLYLLIVSGAYTGTPSPYTMFEGYGYSWVVASLYKLYNDVEWYSIVHYLLSILSFAFISWRLLNSELHRWKIVCGFAICFVLQLYLLISPQNTLLAFECAFAGIIILLTYPAKITSFISSILLFSIGAEIRFVAAMIPFLILSPLSLNYFDAKKPLAFLHEKRVMVLVFMLMIANASNILTKHMYDTEEWRYYSEYNACRGYINDNPKALDALPLIKDANQRKEYELMCRYRVNDGTIMNAADLKMCKDYLDEDRASVVSENLIPYAESLYHLGTLWLLYLLGFTLVLLCKERRWGHCLLITVSLIMSIVAMVYVMSMSVPKERVIIPIILSLTFANFFFFPQNFNNVYKYSIVVATTSVTLLFLLKSKNVISYNPTELAQISEVEKLIKKIKVDKVLVHNGIPVRMEAFHCSNSALGKKMVRVGWLIHSPLTKIYYKNFLSYVYGLPMMVTKSNFKYVEEIRALILSYYQIETRPIVIAESRNYAIVCLEKKIDAPAR